MQLMSNIDEVQVQIAFSAYATSDKHKEQAVCTNCTSSRSSSRDRVSNNVTKEQQDKKLLSGDCLKRDTRALLALMCGARKHKRPSLILCVVNEC